MKEKKNNVVSVERKVLALDTFASGIAQDFNEILAAIMGYVEIALLDCQKESSVHKNLKHAMGAVERAKDLVNDLQVFSRQKELEKKVLDMGEVVAATLVRFQKSLPAQIALQESIRTDHGCVFANPKQIQQIVVNLCSNACNAMLENGGTISVSLDLATIDEDDPDRPVLPGRYFRLEVSDTGQGIDEAILDRIFDPYFTTTHVGAGYGMGLAIVLSVVDALKGLIEVVTGSGDGTTFRVFLPVDPRTTAG